MRLKLGWSQVELSRESGVPRAVINKMEAGVVRRRPAEGDPGSGGGRPHRARIPNYNSVKKLAECLGKALSTRFREEDGVPIGKICTWGLVSVDQRHEIGRASDLMLKGRLSELPVFDGQELSGRVTYQSLLEILRERNGDSDIWRHRLVDHPELIGPLHPCVASWVFAADLSHIIARERAILVIRKGKIEGIATEDDLLKLLPSVA